jgi:KDO2-lipid IV(A) lauroyltransferase
MKIVLKVFFSLPLIAIHLLGCFLGLLIYFLDAKFRERTIKHINQSHIISEKNATKNLIISNAMHIGMALLESFSIWFASNTRIKRLVVRTKNWDLIKRLKSKNKGIIFLTPHIGSFEITAQYYGLFSPIKVMYKPTERKWINQLIYQRRNKNLVTPVNIE